MCVKIVPSTDCEIENCCLPFTMRMSFRISFSLVNCNLMRISSTWFCQYPHFCTPSVCFFVGDVLLQKVPPLEPNNTLIHSNILRQTVNGLYSFRNEILKVHFLSLHSNHAVYFKILKKGYWVYIQASFVQVFSKAREETFNLT